MSFRVVGLVVRVGAPGVPAAKGNAAAAGEVHGHVEAVDHRDVVEVHDAAERELGQRRRRLPGDTAGESAGAVAGLAAPAVEVATGAAPYPAGAGAGGHVEGPRLPRVQLHAAADRDGRRPHREGTSVRDGEGGRAGTGDEGDEEEEHRRGGPRRPQKILQGLYPSTLEVIL